MNYEYLLIENRQRIVRAERRATLMASLGPPPTGAGVPRFRRRRVVAAIAPIVITHRQPELPRSAEAA